MKLNHLVLVRPQGRFPVAVANMINLANISWDILVTCSNHRSWDLSMEKWLGIQGFIRISQLRTLWRSIALWTISGNPISDACTWGTTSSVIAQDHHLTWVLEHEMIQKLQSSCFVNTEHEAHAELRLLHQSVHRSCARSVVRLKVWGAKYTFRVARFFFIICWK